MAEHPTDWFQRHVLEKLDDLGEGQKAVLETHQRTIETLNEHAASDLESFAGIRQEIASLQLVKTIVFGFVGMILIVIAGALILVATTGKNH